MAKQHKNIVIVHFQTQIVDSNKITVIKLFPKILDVDNLFLTFHDFELLFYFLNIWLIIIYLILTALIFFEKAPEWMFFASILIWKNLL
jgi:hypothetical protein